MVERSAIFIGADPELFVIDSKTGVPVSAHDLIPGTKESPFPVKFGSIQVDGVAAEFNIEPVNFYGDFLRNISVVKGELYRRLNPQHKSSSYELIAKPTIFFTKKTWMTIPELHRQLGCDPEYSAYTLGMIKKPATVNFMRTGGGHLHISWGEEVHRDDLYDSTNMRRMSSLVQCLDKTLYFNSVKWDDDKERMKLYGQPGAFRPKSYGVEYRTLSNKWLSSNKIARWVFETTQEVTKQWLEGKNPETISVRDYF